MKPHVSPAAMSLLCLAALLWAGNAVVGRLIAQDVSPMTLNLLRWVFATLLLLPLAADVLHPRSPIWAHWRRFLTLSLLAIGGYNALLYLALNTSTPINVTLVGSVTPIFMLLIGRLAYGSPITARQWWGAGLSIVGVAVVLGRGDPMVLLSVKPVAGDLYMLLASAGWAAYSWMLAHPKDEPAGLRQNWAAFLLAQVAFGLLWSALAAGAEWVLGLGRLRWSPSLGWALFYIAVGPAVVAYRAWGAGVAQAGPAVAGFFVNLIPLMAAVLSALVLGEPPRAYHALAFALIVGGIVASTHRSAPR